MKRVCPAYNSMQTPTRSHFYFKRKICCCLLFLWAHILNVPHRQWIFRSHQSLLFFLHLRLSALSVQTKIKWNNLVFLMLICYLVADGLIHHANTNALPYIHKFLLRNIKCIIWYRLLAHCAAISAHVIKWFMHSFNVELSRRAGLRWELQEMGETASLNTSLPSKINSSVVTTSLADCFFRLSIAHKLPFDTYTYIWMLFQTFTAEAVRTKKKSLGYVSLFDCT